ncbi:MAG: hypothetical protein KGL36_09785 [Gammaproteobacteria bacterium]|nr:hypothetical protein [Gammaproteobacteria bacterium]
MRLPIAIRRFAPPLALAGMLAGCDGTAVVTLGASPAHFLAYRVTLVSVTLATANGASTVAVVPAGSPVDFARLANHDEVLGAPTAVQGSYTRATVTLDYRGAQIVADDGSVGGVALTPVAPSGLPLGVVTVTVNLDPKDPLRVVANRSSSLALSVPLALANSVNLALKTVTVSPVVVASAIPLDLKPVVVRGPLAGVAAASGEYTTGIAPFDGPAQPGQLVVTLGAATALEVDGVPSVGATGSAALAAETRNAATIATGTLSGTATLTSSAQNVAFDATEVLAGTSARSAAFDRLAGLVVARRGDLVTLAPATWLSAAGVPSLVTGSATVTLGPGTAVTTLGSSAAASPTIAAVSVGSRIVAFGSATSDAAGDVALDASAGRVRLVPTSVDGVLATAPATTAGTTLPLVLGALGGRTASAFTFAGTGRSSASDANPADYQVDTGGLALAGGAVGDPVEAHGVVAPFGSAPPDFAASALDGPSTVPAALTIGWGAAGTASPFASFGGASLVPDLGNPAIGARHTITVGAETVDLKSLGANPTIVPDAAAPAVIYAIAHAATGHVDDYDTYADFANALQGALNGTTAMRALAAEGRYAAATRTFTATSITVQLAD